jgi:S-adenosylmethionine-diacylglycerol 3-amino-3-carboxypropyl transferase
VSTTRDFTHAAAQGIIRYSQVWEDHLLLEEGLEIGADDHVMCIASAGDNALALLLAGAKKVTAVDLNPTQTALMQLQLAGIATFERIGELHQLVGASPCADRMALYEQVRARLPESARAFWDARSDDLVSGVQQCGRLEKYMAAFRKAHLAPRAEVIGTLLAARTLEEQAAAFAQLATPELAAATSKHFNRETMAETGRDPSQFRFVDDVDVANYLWNRFRWACTELPVRGNFYLERFLTGGLADPELGPPHLQPKNYTRLRSLIDRVTVVTGGIDDVLRELPVGGLDKAGLSNIFEYLSPEQTDTLMGQLAGKLRQGGRFAYWNLLVDRRSQAALHDRLRPLDAQAHALHKRDRSFLYNAFRLEERL